MTETGSVESLPPLRDVISSCGLNARKSLGQNFLLDLNLTSRIARVAKDLSHGTVIEIGPGPGGLTRGLLMEGAQNIVAIEKDARCHKALASLVDAAKGRLTLLDGDALEIDPLTLGPPPIRIVANLPYNIATLLMVNWLKQSDGITEMVLMFQKEVADRIVAQQGEKAYSRLSVLANWRCKTRTALTLPPQAFSPPPKVCSSVVHLLPYRSASSHTLRDHGTLSALETVTRAAFGQRRKMLRGSLKSLGVNPTDLLDAAGILPTARAEDLTIAEFVKLSTIWSHRTMTQHRLSP